MTQKWHSLIFDEVKAYQKNCAIFGPPCTCIFRAIMTIHFSFVHSFIRTHGVLKPVIFLRFLVCPVPVGLLLAVYSCTSLLCNRIAVLLALHQVDCLQPFAALLSSLVVRVSYCRCATHFSLCYIRLPDVCRRHFADQPFCHHLPCSRPFVATSKVMVVP